MKNYELEAKNLAKKLGLELEVKFLKHDLHFQDDKDKRDIYQITLKRNARKYSFKFGQSVNCSGEYIGHKNLCLNNFGKFVFTTEEAKKMGYRIQNFEIKKNPNFAVPAFYDVLTCLQKYDVGTFEDFCNDFGYDIDSRKAEKTYKAVLEEWQAVQSLFNDDELSQLQEIQ
jgi:hypothetical protein